ncbi:MAG: type II toxin-antitoxin system prevent-host-death family antitoxin [Deltaproteobacteria bacterium]|jgi:prevent-host-death family protein|nr:type II toxin-antitoxin system prevent-host-death family antitoxin [Deltaproteobacteria bacterium]
MAITYSAYDAKARFSEVLRQVRDGKTVRVSYRGKPVAEIRAIRESPETIESRLDDLERQGTLVRSGEPRGPLKTVERRRGALKRFLAERGE